MVQTSWAWNEAFKKTVVPETFVEISMGVIDTTATNSATISTFNENSSISNTATVLRLNENTSPKNYAILEENRWLLDGSKTVRYNADTVDTGFVGDSPDSSDMWYVQFDLSAITDTVVPGLTIVWDSEFGEMPSHYYLGFANTETQDRYMLMVEDGVVSIQESIGSDGEGIPISFEKIEYSGLGVMKIIGEFSGFNMLQIAILKWNTPNHRPRLDRFVFGYNWTFSKNDLLSYTHEQSGDLLCLELPKNSITFSIDNSDDKWNPNNPAGVGKYITDRQMVTVRYGVDIGYDAYGLGNVEWISGGVFYLSEWDIPSNGLEATFVARDPFEFMIDAMYYDGVTYGSLLDFIESALTMCELPNAIESNMRYLQWTDKVAIPDDNVDRYGYYGYTVADVVQSCVNGCAAVCWFDRNGVFQALGGYKLREVSNFFDITDDVSYSHPEIVLAKPIKFVEISYYPIWLGEESCNFMRYIVSLGDGNTVSEGETLRITNDFIQYNSAVGTMYSMVQPVVRNRKIISGSFRANPCLDIFDWVNISTKYGEVKAILTQIKYTYNGSFKAEYTARELEYTEVAEE